MADYASSSSSTTTERGDSPQRTESVQRSRSGTRHRGGGRDGRGRGRASRKTAVGENRGQGQRMERGRGGRSQRRGRARGGSSERRGRARGRGSQSRGRARGGLTDAQRVRERMAQKTDRVKEIIQTMEEDKLRVLVLNLVEREPGLVFDLVEDSDSPDPPMQPGTPSTAPDWCKCLNCREMPTELERKCCGCIPQNCVSEREQMDRLCLDGEVLALGQRYHQEMLGRHGQRMENYNRTMRHAGYRNFILWRHGRLGAGNRRVIPSCCVWRIQTVYPDILGQYTGFIPNRYI